jgi:hypothetical protein
VDKRKFAPIVATRRQSQGAGVRRPGTGMTRRGGA